MGIVSNLSAADQLGKYGREPAAACQASKSATAENDGKAVHAYALEVRRVVL